MKSIIIDLFLLLVLPTFATAQKLVCKDGKVSFFSEAPLEDIEAHNEKVTAIIDLSTKEVAVSIPMKSFKFKKSLMEEHFNENYVESDKFPKAVFAGTFTTAEPFDISKNAKTSFEATGTLTLHGVSRNIKLSGSFETKEGAVLAVTKFIIAVADYDIDIPTLLIRNIAEQVEVTADFKLTAQKI